MISAILQNSFTDWWVPSGLFGGCMDGWMSGWVAEWLTDWSTNQVARATSHTPTDISVHLSINSFITHSLPLANCGYCSSRAPIVSLRNMCHFHAVCSRMVDMKVYSSLWKMKYFGLYFKLRDKLGMVSGVLGHEKFIGGGPRWLGLTVFPKSAVACFGRN